MAELFLIAKFSYEMKNAYLCSPIIIGDTLRVPGTGVLIAVSWAGHGG